MRYVGNFKIKDEKDFQELVKEHILQEYDLSPELRIKHDEDITKKYGHPTEEQRLKLVSQYMSKSRRELDNETKK